MNSGEKKAEGYKFELERAVETNKNIIITVKEIVPKTNKNYLPAYKNSYCEIKINSKKEIIIK